MSQDATTDTTTQDAAEPDLDNSTTDTTDSADAEAPEDDGTDPRVQRANRQAAQYRTQLRETQQQLQTLQQQQEQSNGVLQRLTQALTGDDGADADPAEQLAQVTGEVENLRTENTDLQRQLLVYELSLDPNTGASANPVALLDSRRFTDSLRELDATADDYREQVAEAIRAAVESNSNLRAGQGSRRGGAEGAGRTGDSTVTQEQFNAMGYTERAELFETNPTLYRKLAG